MRVRIEDQTISLEEEQDLGSLSAVTRLAGSSLAAAMRRQSAGEPDPDGRHVWLEPQALRALGRPDAAWLERFDAMLQFARSHGFADPAGRIRAHVETPGADPASPPAPER